MTVAQRGRRLAEQFTAALADPVRGERTVVIVLVCYVALWTVYAVIAKGSQDIHYDMAEQFGLSHELAFGHAKHPPLAAAVVAAWFTIFPAADWAYYLLAVSDRGAGLVDRLAAVRPLSRRRKARRSGSPCSPWCRSSIFTRSSSTRTPF